jgi:hypothetical protein
VPSKADQYEKRYPGTGIPEAQKQERMERMDFKEEVHALRRTGRNRGIVIPSIPWHDEED